MRFTFVTLVAGARLSLWTLYQSACDVDSPNRLYTTFVPVGGLFGFENRESRSFARSMIRNPEAFPTSQGCKVRFRNGRKRAVHMVQSPEK